MSLNLLQNFYKQTVSVAWAVGTGIRYVSAKPSIAAGILTISPSSTTLREIVRYTSTGTDGNGDYVVVSARGLGGTTEQAHAVNELVRMNFTAEHWSDLDSVLNALIVAGAPDASNTVKGITKLSLAPAVAANPIAVGDNDPRLPTPSNVIFLAAVTGMLFPFGGTISPTGFLLCDGAAVSRATYAALFAVIGTSYGAGDGSTTFNVPDLRGRGLIGAGTGTKVATVASRAGNVLTVTGLTNSNNNEFQTGRQVTYASTGTDIGGLSAGTYFLIRVSNASFSLATTLANAQNGVAITLTADGSGVRTFTLALSGRTIGDTGGEEAHAISLTELPAHSHTYPTFGAGGTSTGYSGIASRTSSATDLAGGNQAMNIMSPFATVTFIIKT